MFEFLKSDPDKVLEWSKEIGLTVLKAREYDALKHMYDAAVKKLGEGEKITEITLTIKPGLYLNFAHSLEAAEVRIKAMKENLK